jgi:carboxylate-amine ligase
MWQGNDTGYDSWRTQVWSRFPTAGPTTVFHSLERYDKQADALVASGAAIDRAGLYYDARLSEQWPTVEVRVADVCPEVEDAVLLGVLVRALAVTAQQTDAPPPDVSVELLRAATFMASRWGLDGELVDPVHARSRSASVVLQGLVAHVGDALEASGERAFVDEALERLLRTGNGAARQRAAADRGGHQAIVDLIALA